MKLIMGAIVEGLSTRVDNSLVLRLATQEMDENDAGKLFMFRNKYVKCLISDSNIADMEANVVDAQPMEGGKKRKTPSQRLRGVLYRVWEQQQIPQDFEMWYQGELERLIEQYKEVLNGAA